MALGSGIVKGYQDGSAGFAKNATKAEAVVMIERMLSLKDKQPSNIQFLNELKEVSETGMNVTSISDLLPLPGRNLIKDKITINQTYFTAKVKRLYFIPLEGNTVSFYEPKFIWDRKKVEPLIVGENLRGTIVIVMDITFKTNAQDRTYTWKIDLNDGLAFYYQVPHKMFDYESTHPEDVRFYTKGQTIESVFYSKYTSEYTDTAVQTDDVYIQLLKGKRSK
jgi:hypothetical protein